MINKYRIKRLLSDAADVSQMFWGPNEDVRLANYETMHAALLEMGADQMPFPNQVNVQPAPAVAGDFASTNPRAAYLAGPGGLVCGAGGVSIGRFAWASYVGVADTDSAPAVVTNSFPPVGMNIATSAPSGFVHREQQGLITSYLQESGMLIPQGFAVTLMAAGDFWIVNSGTTQAVPGQYAFANFANGLATFGAGSQANIGIGSTSSGTLTGSIGPQVATFNGSITGNVLTITTLVTGSIVVGGTLSGGTGVTAGAQIVNQLSGTVGGVGTYTVQPAEQTVASALLTETSGLLTVASNSGTIGIGDLLTGTIGLLTNAAPVAITGFGTGSGGAGTYIVNAGITIPLNSVVSFQINVQTKFIALSAGAAGELVKISSMVYG